VLRLLLDLRIDFIEWI